MKKSQWATASGIDHDYNYLKSVETLIETAEVETRPAGADGLAYERSKHRQRDDSGLQQYLRQNRITIIRAPEGMSRSRSNKTRMTNKKNILWTIEIVDTAGHRLVEDDCSDNTAIATIYAAISERKRKHARREQVTMADASHKRRRTARQDLSGADARITNAGESTAGATEPVPLAAPGDAQPSEIDADSLEDMASDTSKIDSSGVSPAISSIYFYLSIPDARSKLDVVAPIEGQQTLTSILHRRAVKEFPTIYALRSPPQQLAEPFILEATYRAELPQQPEAQPLARLESKQRHTDNDPPVATAKMLEMLRRDLTT